MRIHCPPLACSFAIPVFVFLSIKKPNTERVSVRPVIHSFILVCRIRYRSKRSRNGSSLSVRTYTMACPCIVDRSEHRKKLRNVRARARKSQVLAETAQGLSALNRTREEDSSTGIARATHRPSFASRLRRTLRSVLACYAEANPEETTLVLAAGVGVRCQREHVRIGVYVHGRTGAFSRLGTPKKSALRTKPSC